MRIQLLEAHKFEKSAELDPSSLSVNKLDFYHISPYKEEFICIFCPVYLHILAFYLHIFDHILGVLFAYF